MKNVTIVVNGTPVEVRRKWNRKKVMRRALKRTGNLPSTGRLDGWELRDGFGRIIGKGNPWRRFDGDLAYLNVKAGVGGQAPDVRGQVPEAD